MISFALPRLNSFKLVTALLLGAVLLAGCLPKKPEDRLQVAKNGAYSAALGAQGSQLVLGSFSHGGSYWDLNQYARLFNWNHKSGFLTEILYADISANGEFALTANYYNLVLWNTQSGEAVAFWESPARIESADLSADGRFAALGLDNNKAVLFDVQQGGVLREFEHGGPVITVSINVEAGVLLTGSEDTLARLWNLRSAELLQTFDFQNFVTLVKLSPSGRRALIVPANEKAELWALDQRQAIASLNTAKFRLYSARFVGDARLLVGTTHRNIFEFDANTGAKTETWQVGTEGRNAFKSAFVLDVGWRGSQLIAIASNGYLYTF